MNENDAALVSPMGNVSSTRREFELRNRSQEPESPLRSASGGWKRPDSAPGSRGSSRASSFSGRRPEFQRQPLPSSWRRQSFSGQSEALSTVHESKSTHEETEAVGRRDGSAQTNPVPERKDRSTQANIAPYYESKAVETTRTSKTTSSAQTDAVTESEIISTPSEPHSPTSQKVDEPESISTSTQKDEPFSPRKFVTNFGLSSFDKIKRSLSWPINKTIIDDDDADSVDDASTIVEEEVPIRLFGNGEPVDPVLKAFQLQDSVDASLDKFSPTNERNKGLALSKATLRWLREHEPGQRQWVGSESDSPCAVCHATREDAARSVMDGQLGFCSSLNLKYNDSEQYAWSFGSRYIVREKQYWNLKPSQLPAEVWASRLLNKYTKVPTPAVVAAWKEGHVAITIVERAKGQSLAEVWNSMPEARRTSVAKQVAGHVHDWRHMKTNKIAALDGGRLFRDDVGKDTGAEKAPIKDDAQYRAFVQEKIVAQGWQQRIAEMAVELIPACQPFVFTHGNLTMDNIFVREGRVAAITGLGRAAYLPVWAESLELHQAYGEAEREWKEMLFKYIGTEGVKPYYNVYEELMQADEAAIKDKAEAMPNKLADLLSTKRAEEKAEQEAREKEIAEQAEKAAEAAEQEKARKLQEKYPNMDALQIQRAEEDELNRLEQEKQLQEQREAAEANKAVEDEKARKLKEKYPKMNALQIQRAEQAEKIRLADEKLFKEQREAEKAKKRERREAEKVKRREEREAEKIKRQEEREAEKVKKRQEKEAEKAKRREEREQTRKAEGKEVTEQDEEEESSGEKEESSGEKEETPDEEEETPDEEEESPDEEVKIPTPTKEKPRRRGFGESRKFQATNRPVPLFLGLGGTTGTRRGPFDNNIRVAPKASMESSSTKEEKPAIEYYAEGATPNKFAVYHGVPFSPGTMATRKRSSVYLAVDGTRARQKHPAGFHLLEAKTIVTGRTGRPEPGSREAIMEALEPYLWPMFKSVMAQLPDAKIKLTDLVAAWYDAVADMQDRGGPNKFGVHQKMALTLRKWSASGEGRLDLCLGSILEDGSLE
ncbi:hypothetical protein BJ166DRAFT_599394 [Pestalotiopsis sp. NC0098]|nr:hypothetical protein BJ166DRAFT_599394 [Pestalotiopsis sp. NC0098]